MNKASFTVSPSNLSSCTISIFCSRNDFCIYVWCIGPTTLVYFGHKSSIYLFSGNVLGPQWEISGIVHRYDGLGLCIDLLLCYEILAWPRMYPIDWTSLLEFWAGSQSPKIVFSSFSRVSPPIFSTPNTISSFPFYTLFLVELSWWQNLPHVCGTYHFRGKGNSLDL